MFNGVYKSQKFTYGKTNWRKRIRIKYAVGYFWQSVYILQGAL